MLLLDEPTEGVWIGVIEEITERLIVLAKEIAVVIVEQHLDLALRVAAMPMCSIAAGLRSRGRRRKCATIRGCCNISRLDARATAERHQRGGRAALQHIRLPWPGGAGQGDVRA